MGCNCSSGSCSNCKDIQVILPSAVGIASAVDNGGSVTLTYTNGDTFTFNTGTPPNDNWVEFNEASVATSPNFTGTANLNGSIELDGAYKVLNVDTIYIRCQARMNVDITALTDSINFNFDLGTISSNWYVGTKLATTVTTGGTIQGWLPISIVTTTASSTEPSNNGRVSAVEIPAPDGLIQVGETNLQMPNGTYDFVIDFEMTAKLV